MQKEFDRGSPSLTERREELDEQCWRTCKIVRVWSTERVLSSLNGFVVWRGTLWHKGADGDGLRHRERAPASMEQQQFGESFGEIVEGRREELIWVCKRSKGHTYIYSRI